MRQVLKPYVAFKKGSGNSPAYSAMRFSIKEDVQTFQDIVLEELGNVDGLLTEDYLAEGPLDMLRKAGRAAKNIGKDMIAKVGNVIKVVLKKVLAILKKIASLGKKMFSSLMKFLGLEIGFTSNIIGEVSL